MAVNFSLLAVVRLIAAQNHSGFAGVFGVVVPDWLLLHWVSSLLPEVVFLNGFLLPVDLVVAEDDAALVVVACETLVEG